MEARQAGEERGGEERGESVHPSLRIGCGCGCVLSSLPLSCAPCAAGVLLEQCHDHRFFAQGGREGGREGSEVGTGARGVLTPVKLPQRETTSTAQQSILIHANCIEVAITEIEPGRVKEIIFTCEHFMESKIFD